MTVVGTEETFRFLYLDQSTDVPKSLDREDFLRLEDVTLQEDRPRWDFSYPNYRY